LDWARANGYADDLTIERKDNSKGYSPDNCTWIPRVQQYANYTQLRLVTAFGETKHLQAWSRDPRCVVKALSLRQRIELGWTPEEAIVTPLRKKSAAVLGGRSIIATQFLQNVDASEERWVEIPEWPGFEASSHGRVRSYWNPIYGEKGSGRGRKPGIVLGGTHKPVKLTVMTNGHVAVRLRRDDGYKRRLQLSHVILTAFVGPCPEGMEARHCPDPSPLNNRANNLKWGYPSEQRKYLHELDQEGRREFLRVNSRQQD